jgi:hypothetical protein
MKASQLAASALAVATALLFSSASIASGGTGGGGGTSGGGGGGGGGTTTTSATSVLPTTPPAPDVLMRESFGFGPLSPPARPAGGKGVLKPYFANTAITGFWIEYPGSKDTAWLAPGETAGQTWKVCGVDNPNEMPSPLQTGEVSGGCLSSDWRDVITAHPAALMPFKAPASSYEASINGWTAPLLSGTYLGFGFTDSSVLDSNLETSGTLWLRLSQTPDAPINTTVQYELRTNGMSGPVLASGMTYFDPFTPIVLSYNPATHMASASVNNIPLGTFPITLSPHFIGIEGVGIVDNLVVRQLP